MGLPKACRQNGLMGSTCAISLFFFSFSTPVEYRRMNVLSSKLEYLKYYTTQVCSSVQQVRFAIDRKKHAHTHTDTDTHMGAI